VDDHLEKVTPPGLETRQEGKGVVARTPGPLLSDRGKWVPATEKAVPSPRVDFVGEGRAGPRTKQRAQQGSGIGRRGPPHARRCVLELRGVCYKGRKKVPG